MFSHRFDVDHPALTDGEQALQDAAVMAVYGYIHASTDKQVNGTVLDEQRRQITDFTW
jgi:hypothetical protein